MDIVQNINLQSRDAMNNDVSSASSEDNTTFGKIRRYYKNRRDSTSDSEMPVRPQRMHKSMHNLHENQRNDYTRSLSSIQNSISNIDLSLHRAEIKKFDKLQIPIVGYEVMEERARFTIYKLKVEDDKRDQSWLVFRRYTDFVRLYTRLKSEQPNIELPLPGKRWFRDNFEPTFLEERVRGLQTFVNVILYKLPNNPIVREFFCLDEPPQDFSYQPEVQAVYGALEDSITTLRMQLKQKDATIMHLQKRLALLEGTIGQCDNCSTKINNISIY